MVKMSDTISQDMPVIGRFAPSPTGPMHFGTLIAALGSYLLARQAGGTWRVRIEDLDPPRVVPGAADEMLFLLEALGLTWDGPVVYQGQRFGRYREVLDLLRSKNLLFDCNCSRREVLASAPHTGEDGPVYPGTCRAGMKGQRAEAAVRLRIVNRTVSFVDGIFGTRMQNLETELGDFVLHRADGEFAYQLAVVVDDMDAGITQVVRGADLLASTPRQIYLYDCLEALVPHYYHLPLALSASGGKLSKRDGPALIVTRDNGVQLMWQVLCFLGQNPPDELRRSRPRDLLEWALAYFSCGAIPAENRCFSPKP